MTELAPPRRPSGPAFEPATLGDIVAALGGHLVGAPGAVIERIAPLDTADATAISFLANPKYRAQRDDTSAACVIVKPELAADVRGSSIAVDDPYIYFARLTQWWAARRRAGRKAGVHPSAVVDASAQVASTATVGALAFVGAHAVIGDHAVIGEGCVVGDGSVVGAGSRLHPRASLLAGCTLGERCILHSGAVIGADGFGFAPHQGEWVKIEQLGGVRIGNDVEIGANTCVDRGALDDTVIEDGVKIDNLVQIAHNVHIGAGSALAGQVGIAGSSRVGKRCTLAGAAKMVGHIELCDGVNITGACVVSRSITKPGTYSGVFPMDEHANWEKNAATLKQLHRMRERVRALERNEKTST